MLRPSTRHSGLAAALTCTALLGAALFSPAAAQGPRTPTEEPILFKADDGSTVDAFAGTIEVPEHRADPESRTITLHYVRFPGTGESDEPLIYLAGGPGGSGIGTAEWRRFPLFMAMRAYGDVIAFDQRGTGASNDLPNCRSSVTIGMTEILDDETTAERYRAALRDCATFWDAEGIDLAGYTTLESARDLSDLRRALGAETVTLWGTSYGSHLALAAVKEMEGEVSRLVLSSVEGLNQTVKLPSRTDAYFERLQQAVNSDPAASQLYPDIAGMIRRVHDKLEAEPLRLTIATERGEEEVLFQRANMQQLASGMIADPSSAAQLLGLYLALDNGIHEPLAQMLAYFMDDEEEITLRPMSTAMDIASGITADRLAIVEAEAQTSLLRDYLNFPMPHLNGMLGLDLGDDFRSGPVSDVPTLVLTGTLDGRTYPGGQREAVAGLSDVTFVEVTNAGHNLFMSSPEVTARIEAFMAGEAVSTDPIVVALPSFVPQQ